MALYQPITPHQRAVLLEAGAWISKGYAVSSRDRKGGLATTDQWSTTMRVRYIGSDGALRHLEEKGFLQVVMAMSARSVFDAYVLTETGQQWWESHKHLDTTLRLR